MSHRRARKDFPDFFTTKGPISTNITPLRFGHNTYWMSTVANQDREERTSNTHLKPYEDNDEGMLDWDATEQNYDIVLTKSGKFMTSFYVASSLLSFIVGPKGSRLKTLQRTTNTLIKVPRPNEKGNVKITGDTERIVASARTQISLIITQRKQKLPVSHFVSIPMYSESIENNFNLFKEEILQNPARGVTESIFQTIKKVHLTISTLILVDDEEVNAAKEIFKNCHEEIVNNLFKKKEKEKYTIVLQGLEIMNDDPSAVNVLYGNVHMTDKNQSEKLQEMSDKIADCFYKSGLTQRQNDRVKLHVTLINTRYRSSEEKRENFDATDILERYKDFYFGTAEFKNLHLSIRFTRGDNEYYEPALVLEI